MKTGNKNQAMALSVVAVLAVGFLVYQLLPAKSKPSFVARAPEVSLAGRPGKVDDMSLVVLGNPFSHPMLATKEASAPSPAPAPAIDKSGHLPPMAVSGLPGTDGSAQGSNGSADSPGADGGAPGSKGPADSAGNTRLNVRGPRIKLSAILRVGEPVAMLAIDDQPGKTYSEGDLLAPGTRLLSIGDGSVTVRIFGEEHVIATGDTYKPSKDETK
jgi:hypothetical protein